MSAARRVLLRVRVTPRARANALTVEGDGGLRARLMAPPVEGAANRALIELLAARLGVKRSAFEVVRGVRGRDKTIAVNGCSAAEVALRLRALVDKAERRG